MTSKNLTINYQQLSLAGCPICGSKIGHLNISEMYSVPSLEEKVRIDYGTCESCSFVMQINPLVGESLKTYYENSPRLRSAEVTRLEQQLCLDQAAFMSDGGDLMGSSVLDIGADMGKFLNCLKSKYGCKTSYQEHNTFALSHLRNAATHNEISELKDSDVFDWIVLSHVLEHVVDPVSFLKNIQKNITDRGALFIEVPGHSFWDDKDYGFAFEHVNYFSVATLLSALDRAGYIVTRLAVKSDPLYFDGKCRIMRVVAQKKYHGSLKSFKERVQAHHQRLFNDNLLRIQQLALKSEMPIGLYAAGGLLKLLFEKHPEIAGANVLIFDSDSRKHGQCVDGVPIRSPQEIVTLNPSTIIILASSVVDIREQIRHTGYAGDIYSFDEVPLG